MKTNTITHTVLLSLLVLGLTCAVPIASAPPSGHESPSIAKTIQSNTSKANNTSNTHTLVIKTTGSPITYTISASKTISISSAKNESIDSSRKKRVTGRVGKRITKGTKKKKRNRDTTDVIIYSGYIKSFDLGSNSKDIRVFLNGKPVSPEVLTANHIKISPPKTATGNKSQFARYRVPVSGRAIKGESTEKQDTAKSGMIRGRINGDSDSYYFTGRSGSFSFDGQAVIFINGQKLSSNPKDASQSSPQDSDSPQSNPPGDPTDTPQTRLSGDSMGTTPRLSGDSMAKTPNASTSTPQKSSGNGFIYGLAGGVLVMGAIGFAAIKYLRPRQRRW